MLSFGPNKTSFENWWPNTDVSSTTTYYVQLVQFTHSVKSVSVLSQATQHGASVLERACAFMLSACAHKSKSHTASARKHSAL